MTTKYPSFALCFVRFEVTYYYEGLGFRAVLKFSCIIYDDRISHQVPKYVAFFK